MYLARSLMAYGRYYGSPWAPSLPLAPPPACAWCKRWCVAENYGMTACKECCEGQAGEWEDLKSKAEELKLEVKELKREMEGLKSKVEFLRWCSPFDHDPCNPEDDWRHSNAPDVVLVASDDHGLMTSVPAHKAILVNKSPVFRAMLSNEMRESQTSIINISEVSYQDLRAFVNYLYTAEVNLVDDQMAQDLLVLGEKYQVEHLKAYSENFLVSKVNASNALKYLTFANIYCAKDLVEASLSIITENMDLRTLQQGYKEIIMLSLSL